MNGTSAIERFCYLGNLKPVYVAKTTKIDCENSTDHFKLVEEINGDDFLKTIRTCLERKNLPRKDELWYIYAIYMSSSTKQENKKLVCNEFANLAGTTYDLFMFAYYAKQLRENDNKKGFSNSVRRAICNWYEKQDINRFIESISKNIGLYGFTHRDLISLCHVNVKENGLDCVLNYAFKPKKMKLDEENKNALSESMKAFIDIHTYKKSGDNELMKRLIEEKKIDFDNFPSTQRNKIDNWELILPTMTYHQLLDNLFFLVERKYFENEKFNKLYLEALDNQNAQIKENIHPMSFLCLKNCLTKQIRYTESVKQNYHLKTQPSEIKVDKNLCSKLSKIFDNSFDNYNSPPISTLVAINVAEKFNRQSVISQKQTSCFEAAITLALSYYKSEKPSSVYAFSAGKMKKIEWKKNWNFTEASEYCKPYVTPKVLQRLIMPLNEAISSKTDFYDLILIIVGSATFGNSNGKPDQLIEHLQQYRKKKNAKAKVVIINLRRFRPSMEHETLKSDGILEVCGINENTLKIINAFALNHFD